MIVVVPVEEVLRPTARIDQRAKTVGKIGTIFERFELRLRIRVVVGGVGPGMGLGDAQIRQEDGDPFRVHRTAPVGVQGQLVALNALFGTGFSNQGFGQCSRFAFGDEPADDVAACCPDRLNRVGG